jgi:hypothetical protein
MKLADWRMELTMQPLAIGALATTAVMIIGAASTLFLTRKKAARGPVATGRWHRHGSVPLAGAGLVLAVLSRAGGQAPATQNIVYTAALTLLIAAVLCAVTGAVTQTRQQRGSGPA